MPEQTGDTQSTRKAVAEQILANRRIDRSGTMSVDKDGNQYLLFLGGLQATTEYAKTLPCKKWLDIGAGTTTGINELANGPFGRGLEVEATVLNKSAEVKEHLGFAKTHIIPVETLKGIPDASVSIITALNSVSYSVAPDMAVNSIDRVLEPGGVFQGTFQDVEQIVALILGMRQEMNRCDEFQKTFEERGYDTAVVKNPDEDTGIYILLAVKRGANITAQELLDRNLQSLPQGLSEQQKNLEIKLRIGYALGLDLLVDDSSPEAIDRFVQEELIAKQGFSPAEVDLAKHRLLRRFRGESLQHQEMIILQSEDDSIVLKKLAPEDAERYFELVDSDRLHHSQHGDRTAQKYQTVEAVLKSIVNPDNKRKYRFGIWDGDVMVGSDNLTPVSNNRAELGSWIAKRYIGHRYAARARKLLVDFAFNQLHLDEVFCKITIGNEPSRKSVESSGFTPEGERDGQWIYVLRRPARLKPYIDF